MKKITLFLSMLAITTIAISQNSTRCPDFFRRNNGNAGGCDAQITFYYPSCPTYTVQVIALLSQDNNYAPIPGLTFTTGTCSNGKLEVCIKGSNIPTAGSLTVVFSDGTVAGKDTCFIPDAGPTPVNLSSFNANRKNANVTISWKSELEINSKEYIIQRKAGSEWVDIATVASANNALGSAYSYQDNNTIKVVSQYRLKMVDFGDGYSNSEIRTVKGNGNVSDFTVFPNPSTGNAKVTVLDISEPTDVQLVDNSGRVLKNISLSNANTVSLPNLQKGMYMIRLVNKTTGESLTKKLTVVN